MARGGSYKITRSPAAAGETPAKMSEEPSGGNGADYAQDTRYRSDGDGASFRERDKQLIAFSSALPAVLAIQIRGLRIMDPLLMSGVSGLSALIRAVAAGFCCLVSSACYAGWPVKNKASRCCGALLC